MTDGKKGQTGWHPVRENAKPLSGNALRMRPVHVARGEKSQHREGHPTGETLVGSGKWRESLRGPKSPGEQGPRPVLILPVAQRGTASQMGVKPLRRRSKAEEVLEKSAGTERKRGNSFPIIWEEQSFEG